MTALRVRLGVLLALLLAGLGRLVQRRAQSLPVPLFQEISDGSGVYRQAAYRTAET